MRARTSLLAFLVELGAGGFELEAQVLVGAAVGVVEEERACAAVEREGDVAEHVEGGLAGAGLIATDVRTWMPTRSARACWVSPAWWRRSARRWAKSTSRVMTAADHTGSSSGSLL